MATLARVPDGQLSIEIPIDDHWLRGFLDVPTAATGLVVFVLRSGRGRFRCRNQYLANVLHRADIATLMLDLLDEHEANARTTMIDIERLAYRLQAATQWVLADPRARGLHLGYCGVGTGAAPVFMAAIALGGDVRTIVVCGGRTELLEQTLPNVSAPTLLIVGSEDKRGLSANRRACGLLGGESRLTIVPGASHRFSEPGALEHVAALARAWFQAHL